jgi:S-adenosyl methyltransferase
LSPLSRHLDADVRDPDTILAEAARTLDFTQPIALMLLDALPSGSYLPLTHPTADIDGEAVRRSVHGESPDGPWTAFWMQNTVIEN